MIRPMGDLASTSPGAECPGYEDAATGCARTTASAATSSSGSSAGPLMSREIPDTCAVPVGVDRLDAQPQRHQCSSS